jgi:hypothetical protein
MANHATPRSPLGGVVAHRWWILTVLAVVAAPFVSISPALATVGLSVTPDFPTPVTVGLLGIPASLTISNDSGYPADADPVSIEAVFPGQPAISIVPSCGTPFGTTSGDCPAGFEDPGVFAISPTATGETGTGCEGISFTVTPINPATGRMAFVPATSVDLQPPGNLGDICRILFTIDVLRRPTIDSLGVPGQTAQLAFASGVNHTTGSPGTGISGSNATVLAAGVATIATAASPTARLGSSIRDTAVVTGGPGGVAPTATVVFTAFGPDDATCAGPVAFTSRARALRPGPPPAPGSPAMSSAASGPFTPRLPGTYRWIASYSGDANYAAATSVCNDAVVVEARVRRVPPGHTRPQPRHP